MIEHRDFWSWFWNLFGLTLHYHWNDERNSEKRGRETYWYYRRRFWHFYKVVPIVKKLGDHHDKVVFEEKHVWEAHLETPFRKSLKDNWFAIRFHIGNAGSETPWAGHLTLFGMSWFWGHSGFRKLSERFTRCDGYKYDSRDWMLRISDGRLWWEFACHDDTCRKNFKQKRRTFRRGSLNLSIPEAIWGPYRYSYEYIGAHQALIAMPEDNYAVLLTLQKVFYGRTNVAKSKHIQSWTVDVDAPRGIPTHVDHSGGWKGDRTFGFGVKLENVPSDTEGWQEIAEVAVKLWVESYRERTGFVKPDPVES